VAATLAGMLSLTLAACGGTGGGSAGAGKGLTKVDVGILPITSTAALLLGVQKGFFKDEGLDVQTHVAQSGAALVPAIVSGQYQFGFSNNVSLLIAFSKGLPVRIVRTANSAGTDPSPSQEGLVVAKNSPVTSLSQLAGKTIAVNSLNNTPHLADLITLEKAGVDSGTVKFVEVGYPDMPLALKQGRVDAADLTEPFLQTASADGDRVLTDPYRQVRPDLHLSSWFTTQQYIAGQAETARKFARAVDKSNAYARAHTDEIRAFVPSYLQVDAGVAQRMGLPNYPEGTEQLQVLQMLVAKAQGFGFIKSSSKDIKPLIANLG
jgi:NitT/TauT family transport system substrate-binding protein